MAGEIEAGHHGIPLRASAVVDHAHTTVALFDRPDVSGTKTEQVAQDRFVDRVVGHHQGRFAIAEARHDSGKSLH